MSSAAVRMHCFALGLASRRLHLQRARGAYCVAADSQSASADAPVSDKVASKKGNGNGKKPQGNNNKGGKKFVNPEAGKTAEEVLILRAEKAASLREAGKNPFAYSFERSASAAELQKAWKNLPNGEEAPEEVSVAVAGRIMARRVMGKLAFVTLRDDSGSIQLYVDKSRLETKAEGFKELKTLIDAGDFVGVRGGLRRTDKGELSVVAHTIDVLSKSHRLLPDKWHGLQDVEKRYRQRYLDMIMSPTVRDTFKARSLIISTIRRTLENDGFLEVETPVLQGVAGGADARPFITYHNTMKRDFTLRIATELHLKRLIIGGFERVFEIGRIFRNEGISTRHNPEFTTIELYQAYVDYYDIMDLTQNLIQQCAQRLNGHLDIQYGDDLTIDLSQSFRRVSMHDAVHEVTGTDFWELRGSLDDTRAAAVDALRGAGASRKDIAAAECADSCGRVVNAVFEAVVEPTLQQPTFVMDHPVEISPLAKPHRSKEGLVERFELFVAGRELANAFSELTDPVEQRKRLVEQIEGQQAARASARAAAAEQEQEIDPEADYDIELDNDFLTALEYGMPPTGGMGMGIDRLAMLLTNSPSIRDVIAFPLLK